MAKSNSRFLIAIALGLAAGIGIGMLIAPAKGSKTRQRIRKKVIHLAESMEKEFSDKFRPCDSEPAVESTPDNQTN